MANQFRELDTIDFFVDKENEGGASTDPSSSAYTSADDDDVLVDRQNTMQWPVMRSWHGCSARLTPLVFRTMPLCEEGRVPRQ